MAKNKYEKVQGIWTDAGRYVTAIGQRLTRSGKVGSFRWYLGPISDGIEAAQVKRLQLRHAWRQGTAVVFDGAIYRQGTAEVGNKAVKVWVAAGGPGSNTGASQQPRANGSMAEQPPTPATQPEPLVQEGMAGGMGGRKFREGGAGYPPSVVPTSYGPNLNTPKPKPLTVDEAIRLFLRERYEALYEGEQIGRGTLLTVTARLNAIRLALGTKSLSAVGSQEVSEAVLYFCKRPKGATGLKISGVTAKACIGLLKTLLVWLADEGLWLRPKHFQEPFKKHRPKASEQEQRAALETMRGNQRLGFTVEELRGLYTAANSTQRCWMLLALNCGFANMELATLKDYEIDLDAGVIDRFRGKVIRHGEEAAYGKWKLWPETVAALRAEAKSGRADHLALTTHEGQPLIEYTAKTRRDAVRASWLWVHRKMPGDLRRTVRNLSFKHLRKTGATLLPDDALAQRYLSHAEGKQVLRSYRKATFEELCVALEGMRVKLLPMLEGPKGRKADEMEREARKRRERMAMRAAAARERRAAKRASQPLQNV